MNQRRPVVLGISGSLRKPSTNTRLLSFIGGMMPETVAFHMHDDLAALPHFNPDLDLDHVQEDEAVHTWRAQLKAADAIIICTPEYARGVPGSLKNALDWVVSSGEFVGMPTAIISASPHPDGGAIALHSLTLTLKMMSAVIPDEASLSIPFASKIVGADGLVTDPGTLSLLNNLVCALNQAI
ncbi:NADPH-dependent FMN reductase [Paenibacillus oryzisoli]|uniref:NADPH-dependent FMN reductase n=1 Tax=Paenibacillus oryzisoli TaxID=1850517 RepID=UPI003D28F934